MIQAIRICFVFCVLSILVSGCLQTRDTEKDQEEKQVLQRQVHTLQTTSAEVNQRFVEIDSDIRNLNGRIEAVEAKTQHLSAQYEKDGAGADQKQKELEDKLKVFQDALTKLDSEVSDLTGQVAILQSQKKAAEAAPVKETPQGLLASANKLFDGKKWQESALAYEKYRKAAPKGKSLALATYRIGVCFQELGSNDDAHAFYEEVIAKYPKSSEAKKAKSRLASLKK